MTLAPGNKLGPYEIIGPLGAGGMGEVFRARDTRLGRDVAVKVLAQHLVDNPEVRSRFEREARTVSSLNHPHICTLFDVGREGNTDFLVMELVEGETLAQRLEKGAVPPAEALRIGVQIADALDRAHRAGVTHRDLKPGNIMLTKAGAKLMDFGLARAAGMAPAGGPSGVTVAALTQSPTVASPLTAEGTIVGTFQYMAPEQLEGREADARSDLWALGCVLYEMSSGRRAFDGRSQASLIGAIMGTDPAPLSLIAPLSPPGLERLVRTCLEKDPEQRIQTAHDVKLQLAWIAEGGSQAGVPAPHAARRRSRERLAWALAGTGVALAAVLGAALLLQPRPKPRPVIFELTPPRQVGAVDLPRISPDGQRLAFNATDSSGVSSIWVRPLGSLDAQRLPGTEGATRPFWSPDSRFLAFFSGGKLRKVDANGGPPVTLCDAPRGADGTWSQRGVILYDGSSADSVQRVSASGGVPTGAATVDRAKQETFNAWPQFLPDGKHFLYLAYGAGPDDRTLMVGSLGSRKVKALGPAASRVEYAAGHLLYVRQGVLLAQPFDARSLRFRGDPFPVAEGVETDPIGSARFSASNEGTLVFRSGGGTAARRLVWVGRDGRELGTIGDVGDYGSPALSPDGTQLAVEVVSGSGVDIWIWDLARNLASRFTFEGTSSPIFSPTWSPDGRRLAYAMARGGITRIVSRDVGGSGEPTLLLGGQTENYPECWSPDGREIMAITRIPASGRRWDLTVISVGDTARTRTFLGTPFAEYSAQLSPDGRFLAYSSTESGQPELYLQSYPGPGGKWRVSTQGGREPVWRGDGRELYYLSPNRELMAVSVEPGAAPRLSLPRKLLEAPVIGELAMRNRYVGTRDGQRFLFISPQGEAKLGATTVVLNWLDQVRRK